MTDDPPPSLSTPAGDDEVEASNRAHDKGETKTSEDEVLIRLALGSSPFFTCMDEEQIDRFVLSAELQTFRPGQAVILEGLRDDSHGEYNSEQSPEYEPQVPVDSALADVDDLLYSEIVDQSEHATNSVDKIEEEHVALERDEGRASTQLSNENPPQAGRMDKRNSVHNEQRHLQDITEVPPPPPVARSFLYVIRRGKANVFYDSFNPASLGPGKLFGEGGFLFGRQHSASIVASSGLECWVVDRSTFLKHVLQSDNLKHLFEQHAHRKDGQNTLYMTMDDFIKSCLQEGSSKNSTRTAGGGLSIANTYQNILCSSALTSEKNGRIYLSDFCLFHVLMARPDPEVDIVFLLMDKRKAGVISKADFKDYLSNLPYFDLNSEFVQRHFGNGRTIRSHQFSQFLVDLQKEMGRQAFFYQVKKAGMVKNADGGGYLSPDQFIQVLKSSCGYSLPDGIVERLEYLYCREAIELAEKASIAPPKARAFRGNRLGTAYFAYVDFLAFQDVLGVLPGICNLIERACEIKNGPVSPDDLKVANHVFGLGGHLSRRQVDIVFQLFDSNRDGFISAEDAASTCGLEFAHRLEPVVGREGKHTFAPPPNYAKAKDSKKEETYRATDETTPPQPEHIVGKVLSQGVQFLLASLAGGIGIFTVFPLDLVKTRMMNQRVGIDGKRMYLQSLDCLRKTAQHEGARGLYGGLLPPLLLVGPEKAIKFAVNDLLRGVVNQEGGQQEVDWVFETISGGCAGACQLLVTNPLEITKIRMQLQGETTRIFKEKGWPAPKPASFWEVAADLGLSGLYKGAAACLLRDIPFGAIYFPTYTLCKDYLVSQEGFTGSTPASNILLAGTLAAIPASLATSPADMVKTRLQVLPRPGEMTYSGFGDCVRKIYQEEGPTAFFKGSVFRVCRIAPQFGLSLFAYEMLSNLTGFKGSLSNPPTNAPVDPRDYRTAFPTRAIHKKANDSDSLISNLGFNPPKPPSPASRG